MDGYGAQFIVKRYVDFLESKPTLTMINVDYSDIPDLFADIDYSKYDAIVISDLNLPEYIADALDKECKERGIHLALYDHHPVKYDYSKFSDWYNLDRSCCGAQGTYNNLVKYCLELSAYEKFISLVNCYDMWHTDHENFNVSSVLSDMIFEMPFSYSETKRNHFFNVFERIHKLDFDHMTPVDLEVLLHQHRVERYNPGERVTTKLSMILSERDIFKRELDSKLTVEHIVTGITFKMCSLSKAPFQYLSHEYMDCYSDEHVLMNVNFKHHSASFRSRNDKSHLLANALHPRGGGHPNASGCELTDEVAAELLLIDASTADDINDLNKRLHIFQTRL